MKRAYFVTFLIVAIIVIAAYAVPAQDKRLSSAPAEFRTFYAKFLTAVRRGDKATVASMTSFPLIYGYDAGDEGKYTRQEFMTSGFTRMFGRDPRKFAREPDPMTDGEGTSYTVSLSDATHLIFTKGGKRFFFTDFLVEP